MTVALAATDIRSAEILGSIRKVFADKGFDGASMQDLARAAGMSVGNFYRYFPSKAAMIEAIVTRDLVEMEQDFGAILTSADPMQLLRDTLRHRVEGELCGGEDGSLWAEITAAAMRKPEIGHVVCKMESEVISNLVTVFAHVTGLNVPEAAVRFGDHATLIVMLVKASAMRAGFSIEGNPTALVLRMINHTLDEIIAIEGRG